VIAGEDRRHQQSLAPLLTIEAQATQRRVGDGAETGYRVCNIGYGLALNVRATLRGTLTFTKHYAVDATEENKQKYDSLFDPAARGWDGAKELLNIAERTSEPLDISLTISALEADRCFFRHEQRFLDAVRGAPVADYALAVAEYQDMFGNEYRTEYRDERLRLMSGFSRSICACHQLMRARIS
jgi:hypothetical protein